METTIHSFNILVPASDADFVRVLSQKLGWTLHKNGAATKQDVHSPLYYELQEAFHDVKQMVDGKKPKKSAHQLLYELRNTDD